MGCMVYRSCRQRPDPTTFLCAADHPSDRHLRRSREEATRRCPRVFASSPPLIPYQAYDSLHLPQASCALTAACGRSSLPLPLPSAWGRATARAMVNVVPWLGVDSTAIEPPCASTIAFAIASPSP